MTLSSIISKDQSTNTFRGFLSEAFVKKLTMSWFPSIRTSSMIVALLWLIFDISFGITFLILLNQVQEFSMVILGFWTKEAFDRAMIGAMCYSVVMITLDSMLMYGIRMELGNPMQHGAVSHTQFVQGELQTRGMQPQEYAQGEFQPLGVQYLPAATGKFQPEGVQYQESFPEESQPGGVQHHAHTHEAFSPIRMIPRAHVNFRKGNV
ncbi:unnamed protein product [Darwinula stevensoni]|uniref:Uncharacterized protein n=1 Tax=Darwinula stevensoni TaxID=69355 RepID=A0A7R8X9V2_9CRUS|nr:unnamed protein product [Darwinula stevensoni]CAG0890956.1 unnamed protein product [Darwinula stevensoni]